MADRPDLKEGRRRGARCAVVTVLCTVIATVAAAQAPELFIGANFGASEPTNDNYRAHVETGATAGAFGGFMFNDYLGAQAETNFTFQQPDDDHRRFFQSN